MVTPKDQTVLSSPQSAQAATEGGDAISLNSLNFDDPKNDLEIPTNPEINLEQIQNSSDLDEIFGGMIPLRETHIFTSETSHDKVNKNNLASNPLSKTHAVTEEDDDFDDFQMVVPEETQKSKLEVSHTMHVLKPIPVELLKPMVIQNSSASQSSLAAPAKIEWPDPGITEDDIRNIELSYRVNGQNEVS